MNLSELRTALQERREDYSLSSAKLNRKINQAYLDICSRRKWGWLRREYSANVYGPATITGTAATTSFTCLNGSNAIQIDTGLALPENCVGKRVLLGGSFYRIVSIDRSDADATLNIWGHAWLDRPYTGASFPVAGPPPDYGSLTVLYDEIALPLDAQTVVEAVLYNGPSSAVALSAVPPSDMSYLSKNVSGMTSMYSVIQKEPIYKPRKPISAFSQNYDIATVTTGMFAKESTGTEPYEIGDMSLGTYTYWYTNYCKKTYAESQLSDPTTITLSGIENAVAFPDITAREGYVLRVYRSEAGGSVPYLVRDLGEAAIDSSDSDTTVEDHYSDDQLRKRGPDSASVMFLSLYPYPTAAAGGQHASPDDRQIYVLYQVEATAMGSDEDRPLFGSTYSNVLLDGAELLMLSSNDEQARGSHVRQRYEEGIQRMIMQDRMNFQQRALVGRQSRGVRGKPNSWYGSMPDYGSGGLGGF